jgi:hypothetical protein
MLKPMTIELNPELELLVQSKARQSGLDAGAYVAQVLRDYLAPGSDLGAEAVPRRTSVAQRFAAIREGLTDQERQALDDLPTDFAAEHDHYTYGTPKKHS